MTILSGVRRLLARQSMYTLTAAALAVLAVAALLLALTGVLSLDAGALAASGVVALLSTWAGTWIGGRLRGVRPHPASWPITGLILFFLLSPGPGIGALLGVAVAGLVAGASKFLLTWRGRHVCNPAALGASVVYLLSVPLAEVLPGFGGVWWWVGAAALLPLLLPLGLLVLWRAGRLGFAASYALPALLLTVSGYLAAGTALGPALWWAVSAGPILFLAAFMLVEPLTAPPRRWQRGLVGVLVAVLSVVPTFLGVAFTPELALLVGNAVAFGFGQRRSILLHVRESRRCGALLELRLTPSEPLRALPGQYLELEAPAPAWLGGGQRRVLSLASDPDAQELRLLTRIASPPSPFKAALLELRPGAQLRATGVWGDFVLPHDDRPLALIGLGVGVTPFLAQLGSAAAIGRDIVLVHAVRDAAELVLPEETGTARVVAVVAPGAGAPRLRDGRGLPANWSWVEAAAVDELVLRGQLPDLADREVLVSGSPAAVAAVRSTAHRLGARRIRSDAFLGY